MTLGSLAIETADRPADKIIFVVGSTDEDRRVACQAVIPLLPVGFAESLRPERVIHATLCSPAWPAILVSRQSPRRPRV